MATFPDGKRFAFSVFDDTDDGTVDNLTPVYELLERLGFRTTKSVWPLEGPAGQRIGGDSLEHPEYLQFVRDLQRRGFEIALHNVQNGSAERGRIIEGLRRYEELLGHRPRIHCNHSQNRDNIYWGVDRAVDPFVRFAYRAANRFKKSGWFGGSREDSPWFWGDLVRERIEYVRNFVFDEINLDRVNPSMPYFNPARPYVRQWFSSSEGANVDSFVRMLSPANQARLEAEGGVCIMYTHFGSGYRVDGQLDPRFVAAMTELARRPGWFVPVGALLDHLRAQRGGGPIPAAELRRMEWRWLRRKLLKGTS